MNIAQAFRASMHNLNHLNFTIQARVYRALNLGIIHKIRFFSSFSHPTAHLSQNKSSPLQALGAQRRFFHPKMTNKPWALLQQQHNTNQSVDKCLKSIHSTNGTNNSRYTSKIDTIAQSPRFQNMAGIQKLATEPTREHIENIRNLMQRFNAKDNSEQQITLKKDQDSGIGTICIRSAAKNAISAKMMSDFTDVIDELYAWPEGKGVMLYGHEGFFCSGKILSHNLFFNHSTII